MNTILFKMLIKNFRYILLVTLLCGGIPLKAQKAVISANGLSTGGGADRLCISRAVQFFGTCSPKGFVLGDSVIKRIDFGDGSSWTSASRPTSAGDLYVDSPYHTYAFPGVYMPKYYCEIYGKGADSLSGLTYLGPTIVVKDSCADISGIVYLDDNKNCVVDTPVESTVRYQIISMINGSTGDTNAVAFTDLSGVYHAVIPAGSHSVYPGSSAPFKMPWATPADSVFPVCPSSGISSVSILPGTTRTVNFGAGCLPTSKMDLLPYATSCTAVPGDTGIVRIYAGTLTADNLFSCSSKSVTLTYTLHPKQHYCGMWSGPAPIIAGSVLTWNISPTIRAMDHFYLEIKVSTDTSARLGDTLCSNVSIDVPPGFTDPDMTNNTYTLCNIVKSSFDPNEKIVSPRGEGTPGYIRRNQRLTYTIHFQNTGTAPAKIVSILDTIDKNLDLTSMRILGQSHNMKPFISGNVVKFLFEGINLPDSGSNFIASMGSVSYSISPKKNIGVGVPIVNKAAIFFDYNTPVITNKTLNTTYIPTTIGEIQSEHNSIAFPNPFGEQLTVRDLKESDNINLYNIQGMHMPVERRQQLLNTQYLLPGLYILEIRSNEGIVKRQLLQKM